MTFGAHCDGIHDVTPPAIEPAGCQFVHTLQQFND
jgi:hypothetical protein